MGGTKIGGLKAAVTNKAKYGKDFYARIGQMGGKLGRSGGFAAETVGKDGLTGRERARIVGAKGGRRSRRGKGKVLTRFNLSDDEVLSLSQDLILSEEE